MINANELRIGNWVNWYEENKNCYVSQIDPLGIHVIFPEEETWIELEQFDPIPITPNILLKCGFQDCSERKGDKNFLGNIITEDWIRYIIGVKENEDGSYTSDLELELEEDGTWSMDYYTTRIKYLHQLQNLYFSLTNNELNIEGL